MVISTILRNDLWGQGSLTTLCVADNECVSGGERQNDFHEGNDAQEWRSP